MAAQDHVSDIQRTSLAVIEGTGSRAGPASSAAEQQPTGTRSEVSRRLSERPNKNPKVDTSTFGDELVISPERAAALYGALEQFRSILKELVQETEAPQPSGLWSRYWKLMKERQALFSSAFSPSIFGRQLTRDALVAEYATLWSVLERPFNLLYAETALFGLLALRADRVATAQSILEDVKFATSTSIALSYVMRGVMRFVFGVVVVLYVIPFVLLAFEIGIATITNSPWFNVALAAAFGCLGGVVSVLMRLSEFEATKGRSKQCLVLTGATLPLVGGIFAAVIASLLLSKIINFGTSQDSIIWLCVVFGFLAGFSERFTRNVLRVAEGQFSPRSGRPAQSHISRSSRITAGGG
jgi:hypothetical protein